MQVFAGDGCDVEGALIMGCSFYEHERERTRPQVGVCVYACVGVRAYAGAYVCVCVRACVCMCVHAYVCWVTACRLIVCGHCS